MGLSILSGSHRELIPSVLDALREAGVGDVPVIVGGIIPVADEAPLKEAGVAAVYTPKDFDITRIMRDVVALGGRAQRRRGHGVAAAALRAGPVRSGCAHTAYRAAHVHPHRHPPDRRSPGAPG